MDLPVPLSRIIDHGILILGSAVMLGPVGMLLWQLGAGLSPEQLLEVFVDLWKSGIRRDGPGADAMMLNSLVLSVGFAGMTCLISILAAFALVYCRVPGREVVFGAILLTLFFPIETRILPTFAVANQLSLLNSYGGMILPLAATGLGVLIFRQGFRQIPAEVIDAARVDGAGPLRMLIDIILPLSVPFIAGLFAICFVIGWNQYVWPIMIATTSETHDTLVRGMAYAGVGSRKGMALAVLALLPPGVVLLALMRPLLRGFTVGMH